MSSHIYVPAFGLASSPYPVTLDKISRVELKVGAWYEISCDVDVLLRPASGPPRAGIDRLIRPDTPFIFKCDVATITVGVATTSPGTVWVRGEYSHD